MEISTDASLAAVEAWVRAVAAGLGGADWELVGSYAGLLVLATGSIYAGAHGSLPRAKTAKKEGEKKEEEDEDEDAIVDRLSAEDAWLFPIIGSAALVGLYAIVTFLGKEWINWILGWYFSLAGVGSMWNSSVSLGRWAVGEGRWKKFDKVKMTVKKGRHVVVNISLRTPSAALVPLAVVPSAVYAMVGGVVVTDVLALSFAHNAMSLLRLDSFRTGCILLAGLFVYDVWWVFGTQVMVKVATSLDVPIKLVWPKGSGGSTMLGLGDVVIPGAFIALALRYDAGQGKGKRYFWAGMVGYVVGLGTTMWVMDRWGQAQPALLYLSPACILAFALSALCYGELAAAWAWVDK